MGQDGVVLTTYPGQYKNGIAPANNNIRWYTPGTDKKPIRSGERFYCYLTSARIVGITAPKYTHLNIRPNIKTGERSKTPVFIVSYPATVRTPYPPGSRTRP